MTAYRNNFAVVIQQAVVDSGDPGTGSGVSKIYEPVMIEHELITSINGDIVMTEVT